MSRDILWPLTACIGTLALLTFLILWGNQSDRQMNLERRTDCREHGGEIVQIGNRVKCFIDHRMVHSWTE